MTGLAMRLVERGLVPDRLTRLGVRALLRRRLASERRGAAAEPDAESRWVRELCNSPVALVPHKPNEQHYEVPAEFFRLVLGPRLKYSSCFWPEGTKSLADAEEAMLDLYCRRAGVRDGMNLLELGCGWGSLCLWLAERFPAARITAVSNSHGQRTFIEARAGELGLDNVNVITADMNDFSTDRRFDRVLSIEMFEHMRNYAELLRRIAGWLEDDGRLFVHIFCHRSLTYPFVDRGPADWMARHFFAGGLMPAATLLPRFQDDLALENQWFVSGTHYARSARAWLERLDARREEVQAVFERCYGTQAAAMWRVRWRLFFIACEELFDYHGGDEWHVAHYLFGRPAGRQRG